MTSQVDDLYAQSSHEISMVEHKGSRAGATGALAASHFDSISSSGSATLHFKLTFVPAFLLPTVAHYTLKNVHRSSVSLLCSLCAESLRAFSELTNVSIYIVFQISHTNLLYG
jgi:hypothetical protein